MTKNQRKKNCFLFVWTLLFCFLMSGTVFAQTTEATMGGTVVDDQGNNLPRVRITVRNVETGYILGGESRIDGSYLLSGIPPGKYEVEVSLDGFSTQKRTGLTFNVGAQLTINFTLTPTTVKEEVIVTAEAPMVEMTKSEISAVVDRKDIDDLPLFNRDFTALTLLKAGVQGDRANGLSYAQSEMIVDGMSNENTGALIPRSGIPADAIQEFRVITNQFQAEYGRAAGLLRSVATRSGTNDWRGRVFFFYRDEAYDTPNYFVNHAEYKGPELPKDQWEKSPYEYYRFGGYFGGPVIKDKAHFFLAYEGKQFTSYATVTSPLAPETVPVTDDGNQVLLKINYQANEKNLFSFRYNFDIFRIENSLVGGRRTKERANNRYGDIHEFQANWTFFPSGSMVNELRISYASTVGGVKSPNPDAFSIVRPSGLLGADIVVPLTADQFQFEISDNFSLFLANHNIKFGFDYWHEYDKLNLPLFLPGQFLFLTDRPFNPADPSTYPFMFMGNKGDPRVNQNVQIFAVFVQDTWKINNRLAVNLGFRFNYMDMYGEFEDKWNIKNLNPRFGFSWDPVGDGKTSIRGGIGTFTANNSGGVPMTVVQMNRMDMQVIIFPNYPDPYTPNPFFPPIPVPPVTKATWSIQDNFIHPYTLQTTLGFKREFITDLSISADLVWTKGYHIMRQENWNPVIPGTAIPGSPIPPKHKDPTRGDEYVFADNGKSEFKGLYFTLEKRYSHGWALEVSYTLSESKNEGGDQAGAEVHSYEDDAWERQYGPGDKDARHRLAVNGIVDLPFGFQLSGIFYYRSALPWTAYYLTDVNKDSLAFDYVDEHRNARRGFNEFYINARLSKFIQINPVRLSLFVEVYNLTNRTNFAPEKFLVEAGADYTPINNRQGAPNFGEPNTAGDPRLIQFGVRLDF